MGHTLKSQFQDDSIRVTELEFQPAPFPARLRLPSSPPSSAQQGPTLLSPNKRPPMRAACLTADFPPRTRFPSERLVTAERERKVF